MAVNSTQTRTRSNARTGRSPATPAASARRTRPGQVAPAPLQPAPIAGSPIAGSRPKPSASAADVVKAHLKVQVATLRSLEPKVRADEFDSVHQMRVTTRRLRATLRSFGTVIPRSATRKVAAPATYRRKRRNIEKATAGPTKRFRMSLIYNALRVPPIAGRSLRTREMSRKQSVCL